MSARVCKCVPLNFSTNLKFHIVFVSIITTTTTTTTTTTIGLSPGGSSPTLVDKIRNKNNTKQQTTTKQ